MPRDNKRQRQTNRTLATELIFGLLNDTPPGECLFLMHSVMLEVVMAYCTFVTPAEVINVCAGTFTTVVEQPGRGEGRVGLAGPQAVAVVGGAEGGRRDACQAVLGVKAESPL